MTVVARGIPTPTQFAVFAGRLFVAGYGAEPNPDVAGGVYVLGGGKAIKCQARRTMCMALRPGRRRSYLSTSQALIKWSGWNGTRFQKTRVVRTPAPYGNFRGPAVGPKG